MSGNPLSEFESLLHWGVFAYTDIEGVNPKPHALDEINEALGTSYNVNHLDNWLAGRKATPRRVLDFYIDQLILVEVQEDVDEGLGLELRRLIAKKA